MFIHRFPFTEYDFRYRFFRNTQEFKKMHGDFEKQINTLFTEMRALRDTDQTR